MEHEFKDAFYEWNNPTVKWISCMNCGLRIAVLTKDGTLLNNGLLNVIPDCDSYLLIMVHD